MLKIYSCTKLLLAFSLLLIKTNSFAQSGSIDASFSSPLKQYSYLQWKLGEITSMAQQSDQKIVICGLYIGSEGSFQDAKSLARLNPDGSLDPTFKVDVGPDHLIQAVAMQLDGKILIGGDFQKYDGVKAYHIARLHTDGSLDTTFHSCLDENSQLYKIFIQPDGKILVTRSSSQPIIRLNTDGSQDTSFSMDLGSVINYTLRSMALQSDGKILITGLFTEYPSEKKYSVLRLLPDGKMEKDFSVIYESGQLFYEIVVQNDGKILVASERTINNQYDYYLIRYHSDGSVDTGFTNQSFDDDIKSFAFQADGKILLAGWFTHSNFQPNNHVVRLNVDGTIDQSFSVGVGPTGKVNCMLLDPNEKILVGGIFTSWNGTDRNFIARLNGSETNEIKDFTRNEQIVIYPNPGNGIFHVISAEELPEKITVYDPSGAIVLALVPEHSNIVLDFQSFANGMYLVQVNQKKSIEFSKVMLVK
ncbi:MAG: T9SS type A sorting domain-containing protein [Bacteroidetes bacterium]|nr:T9SS type A sorting domain-containing protein [Bacteroidota bacterium]